MFQLSGVHCRSVREARGVRSFRRGGSGASLECGLSRALGAEVLGFGASREINDEVDIIIIIISTPHETGHTGSQKKRRRPRPDEGLRPFWLRAYLGLMVQGMVLVNK